MIDILPMIKMLIVKVAIHELYLNNRLIVEGDYEKY